MKLFEAILDKALCFLREECDKKFSEIRSYLIFTVIAIDLIVLLAALVLIAIISVLNNALGTPWGTLIICAVIAIALLIVLRLRKNPFKFKK